MIRLWLAAILSLMLSCSQTQKKPNGNGKPKRDEDKLHEMYMEFMTRLQDDLDELEYEENEGRAKQYLKQIRSNAGHARDNRPSKLGKDIEVYFQEFLKTLGKLESKPWSKESFTALMDSCSRCHERPQD